MQLPKSIAGNKSNMLIKFAPVANCEASQDTLIFVGANDSFGVFKKAMAL